MYTVLHSYLSHHLPLEVLTLRHQCAYISCNDHASQLVNDEYVQLWGRLAELLLQDLQDVLHDFGSVSQGHCNVAQRSDSVIWN